MANYDQLFVYKSCYDLLLMLYKDLNKLPRDIKYTLLQDIKQDSLAVLRHIYHANATTEKVHHLELARDNILNVKINLRLLWDLRQIKEKTYGHLAEQAENVSKQLAAWHKSVENKQKNKSPEAVL